MTAAKVIKARPAKSIKPSKAGTPVSEMSSSDKLEMVLPAAVDMMTLSSVGAYMFFDDVDPETARPLCEFIIKSNFVFEDDVPLTIFINSPGGSVYDGWGIIDLMASSRLKIQTVGIGLIASMAAVMLVAGTKGMRMMTPNSYVMTHQYSEGLEGKFHELVAHRDHQDELHNKFIKFFVKRTKMTAKQVNDILLGTTDKMLSPKECLKYGLIDVVKNPWS